MNTPKSLSDIRLQDNVLHLSPSQTVETAANRWFHEVFDNNDAVSVNLLFEEDGKKVYEAYQDSGSIDYLYLIK